MSFLGFMRVAGRREKKLVLRWPTFSLRTLLCAVAIVACCGGFWNHYRQGFKRQREIALELAQLANPREAIFGSLENDVDFQFKGCQGLAFEYGHRLKLRLEMKRRDTWAAKLYPEDELVDISEIYIEGGDSASIDRIIPKLPQLQAVTSLIISSEAWLDRHTTAIGQISQLREISISSSETTDRTLESISDLPNIEVLDVSSNHITDAGVAKLRNLTKLKRLGVSGRKVTGEGLAHFDSLEELRVGTGNNISQAGFRAIATSNSLKSLWIFCCPVTDADAACIASTANLRSLILTGLSLSESSLQALCNSRTIESLHFELVHIPDDTFADAAQLARLPLASLMLIDSLPTRERAAFFAQLATIKSLRTLTISDGQSLDDESVRMLSQMASLAELRLGRSSIITAHQRALLKSSLPNTKVGNW